MASFKIRRRCRRRRRDWAGLPRDVLCIIFLKLGTREIMRGAEFACTAWRRVALKEPALWRRIYLPTITRKSKAWRPMLRAALDRAAGQCVAFTGPCDNHSLLDIAERAPSLKRLALLDFVACRQVLDEALKQLPLVVELQISPASCSSVDSEWLLQPVCQAFPRLKKLVLGRQKVFHYNNDGSMEDIFFRSSWGSDTLDKEHIDEDIPIMIKLRYLELFDCELTAAGLTAILDNCPKLKSLQVTGSWFGRMEKDLRERCDRVRELSLPAHELAEKSDADFINFYNELISAPGKRILITCSKSNA